MFSWLDKLDSKPDHPMFNAEAAKKLLADLPKNDPLKALEEVTSWLDSFKGTPGFYFRNRLDVARLLDETGQPLHAELLRQYLAEPHLQDFRGMRLWRCCHAFMKALAETYAVCINEYQKTGKKPEDIREQMPVISVRLLRAVAEQMKLGLMRYIEVEQEVWNELYRQYRFVEENQFAESMVYAYAGHAVHTSPQREFLRALALYVSSPGTLAPEQIEVAYRIAARLAGFFVIKATPDAGCTNYLDLANPGAPKHVGENLQATSTIRFFGTDKVVPRLEEIIHRNERGVVEQELRFGNEFTPDGKVIVLKHLQLYWGKEQPHRIQERKGISATIKIVHGFKVISKLVTHIDLNRITSLSGEDAARLKERSEGLGLAAEQVDYTSEDWAIQDISAQGLGGMLPKNAGSWVKIGALCGISDQNVKQWWVGMVRRLHTDEQGKVHFGIAILTKKPLAVWLRVLGKGAERVSNWETSSGSFAYDYLPAILLPDAHNSYLNATLLMEAQNFVPDSIYEVMMGEKSRNLKLAELLAEGDDYEQVSFQWQGAEG
ncbi:MAG: hypothetical protein PHT15_04365 [Gallionellaceae bacterium]|nr:hypothetical protein [Gallionellaceae bacterium]